MLPVGATLPPMVPSPSKSIPKADSNVLVTPEVTRRSKEAGLDAGFSFFGEASVWALDIWFAGGRRRLMPVVVEVAADGGDGAGDGMTGSVIGCQESETAVPLGVVKRCSDASTEGRPSEIACRFVTGGLGGLLGGVLGGVLGGLLGGFLGGELPMTNGSADAVAYSWPSTSRLTLK